MTGAVSANNDRRIDDYNRPAKEIEPENLLKIVDGEVQAKAEHSGSLDRTVEGLNNLISEGVIEIDSPNTGIDTYTSESFEITDFNGIKDISESDVSQGDVGLMSAGENSFSGDRSTWGTPYQTHRVKLDDEVSQEFEYALSQAASYSTLLPILIVAAGFAYATKVAVLATAGVVYLHTRANRFDYYNDGQGVEFTFRWAEVPTFGTCGLIIPGGTCDDISFGPLEGDLYVFYDTDWDSQ
ncbi:hypothetical protein [Natronorubrum sp. DTA7]|uniref:hypothetical protein n=1 Tax=Natronorubrum sp. DTA7 TaxID=3447016 RepID=UPI003F847D32